MSGNPPRNPFTDKTCYPPFHGNIGIKKDGMPCVDSKEAIKWHKEQHKKDKKKKK